MMRDFAYFCRMNIPWMPPFVVLIAIFMAISLGLYCMTKSRGYLITCLIGVLLRDSLAAPVRAALRFVSGGRSIQFVALPGRRKPVPC